MDSVSILHLTVLALCTAFIWRLLGSSSEKTRTFFIFVLDRAFPLLRKKNDDTGKETIQPQAKKKEIFTCPFSNETNFVQESAEHLPLSPLDRFCDWKDHLATRWLVAGISGQDIPGMLRAGLQKLRNSRHFLVEDYRLARDLEIKKENFDNPARHSEIFVMEGDSLKAQQETLELLIAYLPQRYPDLYNYDCQKHSLTVIPIDKTFYLNDQCWRERPLELCTRIIQEDLVLMRPGPAVTGNEKQGRKFSSAEGYYMAAASVQFSFEDLPQKLGQPLEFIHAPVPGYEEHLRRTMNLLFSKIKADQAPLWRTTWDIHPTGILDHVKVKTFKHVDYETAVQVRSSKLNLKVEYQTIRRLPRSNYLLFTIKSMMDPLRSLESVPPTAAACLAASIRGRSSDMLKYKGLHTPSTTQAVLAYLDEIAASSAEKEDRI